jgi:N-acyl-L-homoserine lactone synthetase
MFVTSIQIERLMLRAGLAVHRIAAPAAVDGDLSVALFIEITKEKAPLRARDVVAVDGVPRTVLATVSA